MDKKQKKFENIIKSVSAKYISDKYNLKKGKVHKFKCCFPNCGETAINSHLLQEKGLLDRIVENDFVYGYKEMLPPPFGMSFKFDKIPLKRALAYPVFCDHHDGSLFKSIETKEFDIMQKWDNILQAYRVSAAERRKEEIIHFITLKDYQEASGSSLPEEYKLIISEELKEQKMSIQRSFIREFELGQFLNNRTKLEEFECYIFPIGSIPICSSAVFTYVEENKGICNIYMNIIPYEGMTWCSFGWLKKKTKYLDSFIQRISWSTPKDLQKLISDILCTRVENWVMSPSFYESYIQPIEKGILKYFSTNHLYKNFDADITINMFQLYQQEKGW